MRWALILALVAGCDRLFGIDSFGDAGTSDGARDAFVPQDAPPPGTFCVGTGLLGHPCFVQNEIPATLDYLTSGAQIDTDTASCVPIPNHSNVCALVAQ